MGKVICEVCGTTYPETASQCPICGLAKPANAKVTEDSAAVGAAAGSYTHVKGGRFSTANVRKRNQAKAAAAAAERPVRQQSQPAKQASAAVQNTPVHRTRKPAKKKSSYTGLVVTALLLLLAIIAVVIYIVLHFFAPLFFSGSQETQPPAYTDPPAVVTPAETTDPTDAEVLCTGITVTDGNTAELSGAGATQQLNVSVQPEGCTETVTYDSSNTDVATVSDSGLITTVAPGSAEITISCGNQSIVFYVTVTEATTAPEETTEPTTVPTTVPVTYSISHRDVSLNAGDTFKLLLTNDATGEVVKVTWRVDKSGNVTISGNTIKGVVPGSKTTVSATIDGQKYSCIVRVRKGN